MSAARSQRDLHAFLKCELGFPAFYGINWNAFGMRTRVWSSCSAICVSPTGPSVGVGF
ncbi:barstar family protein [Streptomyces sp. NPDC048411]|uniref:barstar family protein n=1 Tax=Streptomyces sp. NPDC048411 TaxID=3157206 RepID=UPI0034565977